MKHADMCGLLVKSGAMFEILNYTQKLERPKLSKIYLGI